MFRWNVPHVLTRPEVIFLQVRTHGGNDPIILIFHAPNGKITEISTTYIIVIFIIISIFVLFFVREPAQPQTEFFQIPYFYETVQRSRYKVIVVYNYPTDSCFVKFRNMRN
eukprot:TRINITY_DN660_c0_g2_i6.p2 TRINITY_DN660_c0_g2~~TRINITY_DN660_c0_g2_i6.p2  ORF type:complete len:111 (+),score=8.65 TRINITY_DN660_c0_g2_i6:190-522(+)